MGQFRYAGHTWERPKAGLPVVRAAVEAGRLGAGLSGRIRHACWVLDYTYTAAGLCRAGGEDRPWLARAALEAHLYAPETPYWEDTREAGGRLHSAYVLFDGGEAAGLGRLTAPGGGWARLADPDRVLGDLLGQAAAAGQSWGQAGFWKAQALLFEIVHALLQAAPAPTVTTDDGGPGLWRVSAGARPAAVPELVLAVREHLGRRLGETVTLEQVASACHVSVSTLTHRYRQQTGETPMQTLSRMRINAAKDLLLRGADLKTAAGQLGFCDLYHLSRAFKRQAGASPREWLRRLRS